MYKLVYQCENCQKTIPAKTVDGCVSPPPDLCLACTTIDGLTIPGTKSRRKRNVGDIVNGLLLDYYSKAEQIWRVQCLFCKDHTTVKNNNVSNQKSCGCLKSSSLVVVYFHPQTETDRAVVRCRCNECGLEMDYDLLRDDQPILCAAGCVGKSSLV